MLSSRRVLSAEAADTNRPSGTLLLFSAAETKIWGVGRVQAIQQLSRAQRSTISAGHAGSDRVSQPKPRNPAWRMRLKWQGRERRPNGWMNAWMVHGLKRELVSFSKYKSYAGQRGGKQCCVCDIALTRKIFWSPHQKSQNLWPTNWSTVSFIDEAELCV